MSEMFPLGIVELNRFPEPPDSNSPRRTVISIFKIGIVEVRRSFQPGRAIVNRLWVEENFRGKGLGSLLLDEAKHCASEQGFDQLEAYSANERTANWFRRFKPGDLTFLEYDPKTNFHVPINCNLGEVTESLRQFRASNAPHTNTEELAKSICIRAQI